MRACVRPIRDRPAYSGVRVVPLRVLLLADPPEVVQRVEPATCCAQPSARNKLQPSACNVLQQYVVRENSFVMIQLTISSIATPCTDGHIRRCSYLDGDSLPSLAELCHPTRTASI